MGGALYGAPKAEGSGGEMFVILIYKKKDKYDICLKTKFYLLRQ